MQERVARRRIALAHLGTASRGAITGEGHRAGMSEQELRKTLELLKTEHRDLDAAIAALT